MKERNALWKIGISKKWVGFFPVLIIIIGFILRIQLEERTLKEELDGYERYTQKVKHRLIPGIW